MMWNFQVEGCNQCRFYLEPSFPNIKENFDLWVDNGKYYPDQILPSNIMSPAMNHPQRNVDRLVLSIYFMECINLCLYYNLLKKRRDGE